MSPQWTVRCALLLFAAAFTQVAIADQLEQLRLVCNNDKKVELTRASELAALVSASSSQPDEAVCSPRIRAAIVELDQLINSDNDNVCTPAKINQIRAYYTKFVDKKSLTSQHETKLPKALRDLFLSFGFGVSRLCKTSMISSLMSDAQSLVNDQDFDQIRSWASDGSPIAKMIKNSKGIDDFVLPQEIVGVFTNNKKDKQIGDNSGNEDKLLVVLQPSAAKTVRGIQAACGRRFRPIYGQLIMPMVTLARIGLNYKSDKLGARLDDSNVELWYRIVYLCESLANVEVFENVEGEKKTVRILNSEEAEELRATKPTGEFDDSDIGEQIVYPSGEEHKLDELIVDKEDKTLKKLVAKFEARRGELARLRSKAMRQMVTFMRQFLKSGKVNIVKGLLKRGGVSNMNDRLIKAFDDYASQVSTPADGGDHDEPSNVSTTKMHKRVRRNTAPGAGLAAIIVIAIVAFIIIFPIVMG